MGLRLSVWRRDCAQRQRQLGICNRQNASRGVMGLVVSVNRKLLRWNIKGRGFLKKQLNGILAESRPGWSDIGWGARNSLRLFLPGFLLQLDWAGPRTKRGLQIKYGQGQSLCHRKGLVKFPSVIGMQRNLVILSFEYIT